MCPYFRPVLHLPLIGRWKDIQNLVPEIYFYFFVQLSKEIRETEMDLSPICRFISQKPIMAEAALESQVSGTQPIFPSCVAGTKKTWPSLLIPRVCRGRSWSKKLEKQSEYSTLIQDKQMPAPEEASSKKWVSRYRAKKMLEEESLTTCPQKHWCELLYTHQITFMSTNRSQGNKP